MLTAAVQTVEEVGYARMTVAQVIGRAKVSRKTFYDVFIDREDCFLAAFEEAIAQARALAIDAYTLERGWREGMRAGLARLLAFMDEEPGLARLCVVEALGAGARVLESRAKVLDELAGDRRSRASLPATPLASLPRSPPKASIGAVFAVIHTRLLEGGKESLSALLAPLMSMIVLPYMGARAASKELTRPAPPPRKAAQPSARSGSRDPLEGLDMRLTYRTVRVLVVIGGHPGASNREIAEGSGIADQGQISKLLARLRRLDLVENRGEGQAKGAANAWYLTERGINVERAARPR